MFDFIKINLYNDKKRPVFRAIFVISGLGDKANG